MIARRPLRGPAVLIACQARLAARGRVDTQAGAGQRFRACARGTRLAGDTTVASPVSEPGQSAVSRSTRAPSHRARWWKDPLLALWLLTTAGFWLRFWEADLHRARCRLVLLVIPAAIAVVLAVRRSLGMDGLLRGLIAGTALGMIPVWAYFIQRLSPANCGSGPSPVYQAAMLWTQVGYLYLFCVYTLFLLLAPRGRPAAELPRARLIE